MDQQYSQLMQAAMERELTAEELARIDDFLAQNMFWAKKSSIRASSSAVNSRSMAACISWLYCWSICSLFPG